jgi:hypothetical protein
MKSIIFLFFACLFCLAVFSACQNISSNASNTEGGISPQNFIKKRFAQAQEIEWDSTETNISANFSIGLYDCTAYFDATGKFQYATTMLEEAALPKVIQNHLNAKYREATFAVVMSVENVQKKIYQVELELDTDYITLEFDENGKVLKEIKLPLSKDELERQEAEGITKKGSN